MRNLSRYTKKQIESIRNERADKYDTTEAANAVWDALGRDRQLANLIEAIDALDELSYQRSRRLDEEERNDPIVSALRGARYDLDSAKLVDIRTAEVEREALRDLRNDLDQIEDIEEEHKEEIREEIADALGDGSQ